MNHRKIAELAHVSTSTVSKALSGSREVSTDIAEKIRKIALETGYYTERNKRKIFNKRKKEAHISIVCPEIISIHYSRIITLVKTFVEERGGRLAVYISDFDENKINDTVEYLSTSGETDGIILVSSASKIKSNPTVPVVVFSSFAEINKFDSVSDDLEKVMDEIIDYLVSLDHSKIGFIGETHTVIKETVYRNSMKKHGLAIDEDFVYCIDDRFEGIGNEAARRVLEMNKRPTALIAAYDEVAVSFIHELEKAGVYVPEDISVFGMNDIPLSPYIKSSLSTVRFIYDEQSALAVDILYDKIFGENTSVQHLVSSYELVIRESTARAKK